MGPGTDPGMGPGVGLGVGPGPDPGVDPRVGPGVGPRVGPGVGPGACATACPGLDPGVGPREGREMGLSAATVSPRESPVNCAGVGSCAVPWLVPPRPSLLLLPWLGTKVGSVGVGARVGPAAFASLGSRVPPSFNPRMCATLEPGKGLPPGSLVSGCIFSSPPVFTSSSSSLSSSESDSESDQCTTRLRSLSSGKSEHSEDSIDTSSQQSRPDESPSPGTLSTVPPGSSLV